MATSLQDIEVKVSFDEEAVDDVRDALHLDVSEAEQADIWFCELLGPPPQERLGLFSRHVIIRLRRRREDKSDVTVKLRNSVPPTVPSWWGVDDDNHRYKFEGDWSGSSRLFAASLGHRISCQLIDQVVSPEPLATLAVSMFTDRQTEFAATVLSPPTLDVALLSPLGPISALIWEGKRRLDFDEKVMAEQWRVDDRGFIELSIRVSAADAAAKQEEFVGLVKGRGLDVGAVQTTKTAAMLSYLASR